MNVRFGVSPIAWVNDDMPELGAGTALETILSDAQAIGFSGIELGGAFPRDAAALRPLLESHHLMLIGGWYSASLLERGVDEEIDAMQPHLSLLKVMGCSVFILAETSNAIHGDMETPLAATPRLEQAEWRRFGDRLTSIGDYLADHGLRLAYHHHLGTVVERSADVDDLIRFTGPSVGLTVDTGHAALGGVDAVALIRRAPGRVAHVHCKDVRGRIFSELRRNEGSFLAGVLAGMFTVPGDGDLDFMKVMQALASMGYSGWIVVEAEQDPAIADPRQYGAIGFRTLKEDAAAAGLLKAA